MSIDSPGPAGGADPRLAALVSRVARHVEAIATEPPEAAIIADLASVCRDPDAPESLRLLAESVARGETTWEEVWGDPLAYGQDGLDLLGGVMGSSELG